MTVAVGNEKRGGDGRGQEWPEEVGSCQERGDGSEVAERAMSNAANPGDRCPLGSSGGNGARGSSMLALFPSSLSLQGPPQHSISAAIPSRLEGPGDWLRKGSREATRTCCLSQHPRGRAIPSCDSASSLC